MENPEIQDVDNVSEDESQDENIVQNLLCETAHLKQFVTQMNPEKLYMI